MSEHKKYNDFKKTINFIKIHAINISQFNPKQNNSPNALFYYVQFYIGYFLPIIAGRKCRQEGQLRDHSATKLALILSLLARIFHQAS